VDVAHNLFEQTNIYAVRSYNAISCFYLATDSSTSSPSNSNKMMVAFDWSKELIAGRDVSRFWGSSRGCWTAVRM